MAYKVYLGVGHGGSDPGAVGNGFRESDLNLKVAKYCNDALKRCGIDVKMSRTDDSPVWLEDRIKGANNFKADLALDIHHNAGGGDGAEVYCSRYLGKSKTLSNNILSEMKKIGQNSRGVKVKLNSAGYDYFGFIRQTNMPAVLVECAFVDNKNDIKIVDTAAEQKKMGEAIAKAICTTLKVKYVTEAKPAAKPATEPAAAATYVKGQAIKLKAAPLYASATAKKAVSNVTGTYYIYDGKKFSGGRYRITITKDRCGKTPAGANVTGYVKL